MRILLFIFALFGLEIAASAANLCVSVSSSGGADGSDWNNALAASFTPVRGNTYYLADGSYSSKTWSVAASSSTLITIKKATATDHVTETGWSSTMGDGQSIFSAMTVSTSDWLFDGQAGGGQTNAFGHGILITNTAGDLFTFSNVITNITIRHFHLTSNRGGGLDDGTTFLAAIKATTGGTRNLTVSRCSITDIFGPPFHISNITNGVFEYLYVARNRSTPSWHSEMVSSINNNFDLTWRWSIYDQIEGTAVFAGINTGLSDGWKIYGNVFTRSVTPIYYYWEPPGSNQQLMTNSYCLNNTIYNQAINSIGNWNIQNGGTNFAYNNLYFTNDANSWFNSMTADYDWASYNIRSADGPFDKDSEVLTSEANGIDGSSAAPFTRYNPDPLAADLSLAITITAGTNTSTMVASNSWDMWGNLRTTNTWQRGAFQAGVPAVASAIYRGFQFGGGVKLFGPGSIRQ